VKYYHLVTFLTVLSCPVLIFFSRFYAQVEPLDRFSRFMAQNSPKMGVNRQFLAKTAKYKNRNISETINRIKTKFEDQAETGNCTLWVV